MVELTGPDKRSDLADAAGPAGSAIDPPIERHRVELRLHCYRMLGSLLDSDDLVEETLRRAGGHSGRGEASPTSSIWLYRLATTACLDALAMRPPRVLPRAVVPASDPEAPPPAMTEHAWLEPYPDHLLGGLADRTTIDLAFLAASQQLPPKQRAALILRDVLGWPANDTAALLAISVPATKSALQRARATLNEHVPADRDAASATEEAHVLERYLAAVQAGSTETLAGVLAEDVRASFPPMALWVDGRDDVLRRVATSRRRGAMRGLATAANMQPAAALYLRSPDGDSFALAALAVLRIADGTIAEIVEFSSPDVLSALGLPATL